MTKPKSTPVIILDFGSQFTQLIARLVRECGVYCEIEPYHVNLDALKAKNPRAIILSGGPASVGKQSSPSLNKVLLGWNVPTLGICYGMQLLSHLKSGKVGSGKSREYGACEIEIINPSGLFKGFKKGQKTKVWMSHGDSVETLPADCVVTAKSDKCIVGFEKGALHAVQFHPEVAHTPIGKKIIENFLFELAGLKPDWKLENFLNRKTREVLDQVGDSQVIGGISGGVDSTILAVFLGKVLGKRFHPVLVDNGLLRKNEAKEVAAFLKTQGVSVKVINASELFLKRLNNVTDPERKRKIIGKTFIEVFEKECQRIKGVGFLAQGTLYPDVIESVSVKGPSHTIKTHHNVGGLPKRMKLKLIEPFRELFKDEVRALGRTLRIPEQIIGRHPFPGPGLAVRIIGKINEKRLELLRDADSIFIEELKETGKYQEIWQAFSVILPIKSVGVMGDSRTYESVVVLRAVTSRDGMTADWFDFDKETMARISNRIINEVPGINRVVYDVSSKPPATIEWE
ncbi:glutamine-hydrolyzing GMP synthase [bacterium]|nr:glutamine-hydrolyzing GMP synthase [bacterium]